MGVLKQKQSLIQPVLQMLIKRAFRMLGPVNIVVIIGDEDSLTFASNTNVQNVQKLTEELQKMLTTAQEEAKVAVRN